MRDGRMSGILFPVGYFTFLFIVLWAVVLSIQTHEPTTPEGLIPGRLLGKPGAAVVNTF